MNNTRPRILSNCVGVRWTKNRGTRNTESSNFHPPVLSFSREYRFSQTRVPSISQISIRASGLDLLGTKGSLFVEAAGYVAAETTVTTSIKIFYFPGYVSATFTSLFSWSPSSKIVIIKI